MLIDCCYLIMYSPPSPLSMSLPGPGLISNLPFFIKYIQYILSPLSLKQRSGNSSSSFCPSNDSPGCRSLRPSAFQWRITFQEGVTLLQTYLLCHSLSRLNRLTLRLLFLPRRPLPPSMTLCLLLALAQPQNPLFFRPHPFSCLTHFLSQILWIPWFCFFRGREKKLRGINGQVILQNWTLLASGLACSHIACPLPRFSYLRKTKNNY